MFIYINITPTDRQFQCHSMAAIMPTSLHQLVCMNPFAVIILLYHFLVYINSSVKCSFTTDLFVVNENKKHITKCCRSSKNQLF